MEILDRMPFMAKNAVFKKLAEIADVNTLTQEEHEKYDSSIKVLRDNIAVYQGAIQKGREEGELAKAIAIARSLKQMGMADSDISKATGLPAEDIANP